MVKIIYQFHKATAIPSLDMMLLMDDNEDTQIGHYDSENKAFYTIEGEEFFPEWWAYVKLPEEK